MDSKIIERQKPFAMRKLGFILVLLQSVVWLSCHETPDNSIDEDGEKVEAPPTLNQPQPDLKPNSERSDDDLTSEETSAGIDKDGEKVEATPTLNQPQPAPKPVIDTFYNDFAGLYAGDTNTIKNLIDSADWPIWMDYSKRFRKDFTRTNNALRSGINEWRLDVLNPKIEERLDLLYLFSGPDILYPRLFFPDASHVYMCALEQVSPLPNYTEFSKEGVIRYQKAVQKAFYNIFGDSYYITDYMNEDLRFTVRGVLPVMLVTAKINGGTIEEVFFFEPNENGGINAMEGDQEEEANGVSVRVRYPDNKVQQYLYYSGNLGDEQYGKLMGLDSNQNLRSYFNQLPQYNSFIKAASYIPHMTQDFSFAIDILAKSESIFQDPTGLSCSMVSQDTSRTMYVMGKMQKGCQPLHHFGWVSFDCLIAYHKEHPELKLEEPPFKFGYQKRQKQAKPCFNYQLIVKK